MVFKFIINRIVSKILHLFTWILASQQFFSEKWQSISWALRCLENFGNAALGHWDRNMQLKLVLKLFFFILCLILLKLSQNKIRMDFVKGSLKQCDWYPVKQIYLKAQALVIDDFTSCKYFLLQSPFGEFHHPSIHPSK